MINISNPYPTTGPDARTTQCRRPKKITQYLYLFKADLNTNYVVKGLTTCDYTGAKHLLMLQSIHIINKESIPEREVLIFI